MAMRVTDYVSFTTNNCFCILQLSNRDILLTLFFFTFQVLMGDVFVFVCAVMPRASGPALVNPL